VVHEQGPPVLVRRQSTESQAAKHTAVQHIFLCGVRRMVPAGAPRVEAGNSHIAQRAILPLRIEQFGVCRYPPSCGYRRRSCGRHLLLEFTPQSERQGPTLRTTERGTRSLHEPDNSTRTGAAALKLALNVALRGTLHVYASELHSACIRRSEPAE